MQESMLFKLTFLFSSAILRRNRKRRRISTLTQLNLVYFPPFYPLLLQAFCHMNIRPLIVSHSDLHSSPQRACMPFGSMRTLHIEL